MPRDDDTDVPMADGPPESGKFSFINRDAYALNIEPLNLTCQQRMQLSVLNNLPFNLCFFCISDL